MFGKSNYKDEGPDMDEVEFKGFMGLLILMGTHKDRQEPIVEMFSCDEGRKMYKDLFSLNRFRRLTRALHFDNAETREERQLLDKFCPIREMWDVWVNVANKSYNPGENVCIDEQLVSFRRKLFLQTIH